MTFSAGEVFVDFLRVQYGISLAAVLISGLVHWVWFILVDSNCIVDWNWGFAQFLIACVCFGLRQTDTAYHFENAASNNGTNTFVTDVQNEVPIRNIVALILVFIWMFRLSFLNIYWTRIRLGHNDARYIELTYNVMRGGRKASKKAAKKQKNSTTADAAQEQQADPAVTPAQESEIVRLSNAPNTAKKPTPETALVTVSDLVSDDEDDTPLTTGEKNKFMFGQLLGQAILTVFPSTALYFVFGVADQRNVVTQWPFWVGTVLVLVGIVNSHLADTQLEEYKAEQSELRKKQKEEKEQGTAAAAQATPEKKGLCRKGWWGDWSISGRGSRHPNLFFELVTWVGFAFLGIDADGLSLVSLFGFFGVVVLWAIMRYLTIPITEKDMASRRPNWKELIAESNMFWVF